MRILLLLTILLSIIFSCSHYDKKQCEKYCKKGLTLAKKSLSFKISSLSEDAKAEANIYWKSNNNQLKLLVNQCVERCEWQDKSFGNCIEKASSLNNYISCLK